MSHTLTQPQEVEQIFMEMAWNEVNEDESASDYKQPSGTTQERWFGGYVSPYRAMHMKSIQSMFKL
jgi:hypothetical protein